MKIVICQSEKELLSQIPNNLKPCSILNISVNLCTKSHYVQAVVKTCFKLSRQKKASSLKFVLQDDSGISVDVFAFGSFAEELSTCDEGDILCLTGFTVEEPIQQTSSSHPCSITLDPVNCETCSVLWLKCQSNSSKKSSKKTTPQYSYKALKDVQTNTVVNVYGVVKFLKVPRKTRGTDYSMLISLMDPSLNGENGKLKILIFMKDENLFPPAEVGDVIRFHRLRVGLHGSELQGTNSAGFSWVLFPASDPSNIKASSSNYTYTDSDKQKVEELLSWATQDRSNQNSAFTVQLKNISANAYFNLVCQVVSTCIFEPDVSYLIRIWDGTKSLNPVAVIDALDSQITQDDTLAARAEGMIYDICLFDDHFYKASKIKPGDVIKLTNLHAPIIKTDPDQKFVALPMVELCLHRGTSFGRGVTILKSDSKEATTLLEFLQTIRPYGSFTDSSSDTQSQIGVRGTTVAVVHSAPVEVFDSSEEKSTDVGQRNEKQLATKQAPASSSKQYEIVDLDTPPKCMMDTVTVITDHHHVALSSLFDVLQHEVPYKFHVQATVRDYLPKPASPRHLIHLYCSGCQFLCPVDAHDKNYHAVDCSQVNADADIQKGTLSQLMELAEADPMAVDEGGNEDKINTCPSCSTKDKVVELSHVYLLKLILSDADSWLMAYLWKEHAVKFFQGIEAVEVLKNPVKAKLIQECIDRLCPLDSDPNQLLMECCIFSFNGQSGVRYQIFDTVVV